MTNKKGKQTDTVYPVLGKSIGGYHSEVCAQCGEPRTPLVTVRARVSEAAPIEDHLLCSPCLLDFLKTLESDSALLLQQMEALSLENQGLVNLLDSTEKQNQLLMQRLIQVNSDYLKLQLQEKPVAIGDSIKNFIADPVNTSFLSPTNRRYLRKLAAHQGA